MAALYAAALTAHILMTGASTIFNLTPDEYSVTAIAAYLNGLDWSPTVSAGGYYGYFQSLFYVPVFWITDEPYLRYRLMLAVNGILAGLIPVIAYWLSRRAVGAGKLPSAAFALICGMYPSYMLLTKFTWNETMCCLLPWVFLLLMYKALDCAGTLKKQIFSCLGGLTLAAAYATHGRMLALVAAGVVTVLVVYFTMKRRLFCFTGFFGSLGVGLVVDKLLKRYFQAALWNVGNGRSAPINTLEKMMAQLEQLFGGGGNFSIERFFETLTGHFFYFFSSTWGFGAVCVIAVIAAIAAYYRGRKRELPDVDDKTAVLCWFTLLFAGAAFAVSVVFKCTSSIYEKRMDTTIYGRYTEAVYPIAILCTLALIYKRQTARWQALAAAGLNAAVTALTQLLTVPTVTNSETFVSAMVLGLAPMRYGEKLKDLYTQETFLKIYATVTLTAAVWTVIGLIRRLERFKWAMFALPLAGLMTWTSVYGYNVYIVPQARNAKRGADEMSAAVDRLDGDFDEITLFSTAQERCVKTQFLYPEMTVRTASSVSAYRKLENKPDILLAGSAETPELWFDELRLIGSLGNAVHIFAASDAACDWAVGKGCKLGESGAVVYSPEELKTNSTAVKTGFDKSADLDYADNCGGVTLTLPKGAAAYTNYTNLQKGTYSFTVYGDGVGAGTVTLYADKGKQALPFDILTDSADMLCAAVTVDKKTENIRFTLTNTAGEPLTVESIVIRRMN